MEKSVASLCSRKAGIFCFLILVGPIVMGQHREIDSLENELGSNEDSVNVSLRIRLSELYSTIDFNKSRAFAKEAQELAHRLPADNLEFKALNQLAKFYSNNQEGVYVAQQMLQIAQKTKDEHLLAISYLTLADALLLGEYVSTATQEYTAAYKLYERLGDQFGMGMALNGLGEAKIREGDPSRAEEYFRQAFQIFTQFAKPELSAKVLASIGETLTVTRKYDESLACFSQALKFSDELNGVTTAFILARKAASYKALNNYDKAIDYLEKAISLYNVSILTDRPIYLRDKASCQSDLGLLLVKKGDYSGAINIFNKVNEITDISDYSGLAKVSGGLAIAYEKLGDYKTAFAHRTVELVSKDSLSARRQMQKSRKLQSDFLAESSEQKIVQLQADKNSSNTFLIILSSLLLLSLVLVVVYVSKLKIYIRKSGEAAKIERHSYEEELISKRDSEKQLRQEVEFKTSELTTFTLHLIQKNEVLDAVRREVDEIRRISSDEIRNRINRMITSINLSQNSDKNWESFKLYFDQANRGFFDHLTASYPHLNGKDLKLCALLRLNLDTKQIATILDISPDSAKVARHRVRKKIGLPGDNSLYQFLNTF